MSKIGKKPIIIPDGITAEIKGGVLIFKKGEEAQEVKILPHIGIKIGEEKIDEKIEKALSFSLKNDIKQARANWGTLRALAQNAINGLKEDFKKILIIEGVGYRVQMEGENLILFVGFSHPVKYSPRVGIKIATEKNQIVISGKDKVLVGQTAAEIRKIKKPEPYKGKGIRYKDEVIKRKVGKKTGATK